MSREVASKFVLRQLAMINCELEKRLLSQSCVQIKCGVLWRKQFTYKTVLRSSIFWRDLQSCVESDQLELPPRKVDLVIACCTRFRENEVFVENFEKNAKKDNSF